MLKVWWMVLVLLVGSGLAYGQAQTVRAGISYSGGTQLELPSSGATFTVPRGWVGQYNPREKLLEMNSSSGQQVSVGYEGKTYADALEYAKHPITTSDGIVMKPIGSKQKKGKFEVFFYSGKALLFMDVSAVAFVIKTPTGKALTISSGGLGSDLKQFGNQIGLVMPTLSFSGQAKQRQTQFAGGNPALLRGQQSAAHTVHAGLSRGGISGRFGNTGNQTKISGRYPIQDRAVAGIKLAGEVNRYTVAPPSWVKYSKRDPFKSYGNISLPIKRNHLGYGLFDTSHGYVPKSSAHSDRLLNNYWVNKTKTRKVSFCASNYEKESYGNQVKDETQGSFVIYERKSRKNKWQKTDTGRFQIYRHENEMSDDDKSANEFWNAFRGYNGQLDTMFMDRINAQNDVVLVEQIKGEHRGFWTEKVAFNGKPYTAFGANMRCPERVGGNFAMSNCLATGKSDKMCLGIVFPDEFDTAGNKIPQSSSERSSSSGSYSNSQNGSVSVGGGCVSVSIPGGAGMMSCD